MKKILSLLLVLLLCLGMAGCGNVAPAGQDNDPAAPPQAHGVASGAPARPEDGTLEFWIAESVEWSDFNGHDEIADHFGAREFLGTGYRAVTDENGWNASRPDVFVSYIITNYPDYSSEGLAVSTIWITDPDVTVYGLTVDSSLEEWDAVMREMGYAVRVDGSNGQYHRAKKDGFSFFYGDGSICINAEVTNEQGIVF